MHVSLGNVYWLKESSGIPHPQVVIQINAETVVVCALTTNATKAAMPGNVVLNPGEGGLPKLSIVEVAKKSVIQPSELGELIGTLSEHRVAEILVGIDFIQKSFFAPRAI